MITMCTLTLRWPSAMLASPAQPPDGASAHARDATPRLGLATALRAVPFGCGEPDLRAEAAAARPAVPVRPSAPHTSAEADRASGVRVRRPIECRLCPGRDPADPLDRRRGRLRLLAVGGPGRGRGDADCGGELPAERARLP